MSLAASPAAVRGPDTSPVHLRPLPDAPSGGRRRAVWAGGALGAAALVAVVAAMLARDRSPRTVDKVDVAHVVSNPTKPALASVRLSVDSSPQDAEVTDVGSGRSLGRTPFAVTLNRGTTALTFRFVKAEHQPALYKIIPDLDKTVRVDLKPDATKKEPVQVERRAVTRAPVAKKYARLVPAPQGARARLGMPAAKDCLLTIGSVPWAELWIDGKDSGQPTPVVHLPVTCGLHKLRFKRSSPEIDHVESINLTVGQELKRNFTLESSDQDG